MEREKTMAINLVNEYWHFFLNKINKLARLLTSKNNPVVCILFCKTEVSHAITCNIFRQFTPVKDTGTTKHTT